MLATIDRQRSELARFLSPQVAALVSSDDGEAMLAGHRREITAMFCDLRNFTVVLRGGRARGGPWLPAGVPRRDGAAHRRPRGDARALRRRRVHDVLQRPGAAAGSCRSRGRAGRRDARALLRRCRRGLAEARIRPGDRDRDRDRVRHARAHRVRGPLRLRRGGPRDHPGGPPERRSRSRARSSSRVARSPPPRPRSRRRRPASDSSRGSAGTVPVYRGHRHARSTEVTT